MYYYATPKTTQFLLKQQKKVYLYGSNMGYANFGDIIQLKNEIKFHKNSTGYEPVVLLRLDAPFGGEKFIQNQEWYDTEHFVYMSREYKGEEAFGDLRPIEGVRQGVPLHVYGGGFLNGFWGKDMLGEIRSVLDDFGVEDYVFSGQQIAEAIIPDLEALFAHKEPALFGLRDRQSHEFVKAGLPDVESHFSFDDVTEILVEWLAGAKPSKARDTIAWHFNTTHYVAEGVSSIQDKMQQLRGMYPTHAHVVLQAYNDKSYQAKDSLQTIVDMESEFPFTHYGVVNLGQMALEMDANTAKYPDVKSILSNAELAVTSSYHTAMVMNYLGVPAFLMAANDYYAQKQKGLGYSADFAAFLKDPTINLKTFAEDRSERDTWLETLETYFADLD